MNARSIGYLEVVDGTRLALSIVREWSRAGRE
jgi:hypothetical protein